MAVKVSGDGAGYRIQVEGVTAVAAALRDLDPKLRLAMYSEIRGAVNKVGRDARSLAPSRTGDLRAGIRVKKVRPRGGDFGYKVVSDTAQGAILELAGASSAGKTPQGRSLIQTASARWGQPGRFVWNAWDRNKSATLERIGSAVRKAERRVQAAINGAGR